MKPFFQGPFHTCKIGQADLKEELEKVIPLWGWKGNADELMEYWFKDATINQDVIRLVKGLQKQGVQCYLATNQTRDRAEYLLNVIGLGALFDGIYNSAAMGCLKDESIFFKKILEDQALQGSQVLFIEHDENNLNAAQAAGIQIFRYTDVSSLKLFLEQV